MRVCDICLDPNKSVLDLRLSILKPDPDNNRVRPEPLETKSLELCEGCVKVVWDKVVASLVVRN